MIITKPRLQALVNDGYIKNKNRDIIIDVASICLHMDNMFTTYDHCNGEPFTPPKTMPSTTINVAPQGFYILPPGGIVLACTEEEVEIPTDRFGFVQTKGSIARGFISVHMSDGQVDPGYKGKITLELFNASAFCYKLVPGMQIASLFFMQTDAPVESYNGRYQGSYTPTTMKSRT